MKHVQRHRAPIVSLTSCLVLLAACGGGGDAGGGAGPGPNPGPANQQALQAEIDRLFPFTPNQPFEVIFECTIGNVPGLLRSRPDPTSGRDTPYYIEFRAAPGPNQSFTLDVSYELDDTNRSHLMIPGTYTYTNGQIRIDINTVVAFATLAPFPRMEPVVLSETSTRVEAHLGLVGGFETNGPNPIACRAIGHRNNQPAEAADTANYTRVPHYECQRFASGNTSEQNTFEFAGREMPQPGARNTPAAQNWVRVPGSFFRQREVGSTPLISRGSGGYRRLGDTFYVDFGPGVFDDFALLKGTLANFGIEQFPAQNPCSFSTR